MPILIAKARHFNAALSAVPMSLRRAYDELPNKPPRKPTKREHDTAQALWEAVYAVCFAEQIAWCKEQGMTVRFILPGDERMAAQYHVNDPNRIAVLAIDDDEDSEDSRRFDVRWGDPCKVGE